MPGAEGSAGILGSSRHVQLLPPSGAQPARGAGFGSWPRPLPPGPVVPLWGMGTSDGWSVSPLWAQAPASRGADTSNKALAASAGWEPRLRCLQGCEASSTPAALPPARGRFPRPTFPGGGGCVVWGPVASAQGSPVIPSLCSLESGRVLAGLRVWLGHPGPRWGCTLRRCPERQGSTAGPRAGVPAFGTRLLPPWGHCLLPLGVGRGQAVRSGCSENKFGAEPGAPTPSEACPPVGPPVGVARRVRPAARVLPELGRLTRACPCPPCWREGWPLGPRPFPAFVVLGGGVGTAGQWAGQHQGGRSQALCEALLLWFGVWARGSWSGPLRGGGEGSPGPPQSGAAAVCLVPRVGRRDASQRPHLGLPLRPPPKLRPSPSQAAWQEFAGVTWLRFPPRESGGRVCVTCHFATV